MKNLKKYLALFVAVLMVLSFAACASGNEDPSEPAPQQTEAPVNENPTEEATEAPTAEATQEVTEVGADYSAYKGLWHSGSVTLKIEAENKWSMEDNGDLFLMGQLIVDEEDGGLHLYDVEGTEAAKILIDNDGSMYAELYTEELYSRIEDFFFSREQEETGLDVEIDDVAGDEPVIGEDSSDIVVEG